MTNANHVGDRNKLVVGDNDHGDSKPTLPMYSSVLADNAALREDLKDSLEAHDEMRQEITTQRIEIECLTAAVVKLSQSSLPENVEISILRKERDAARVEVCYAQVNGQYGRRYTPQDIAKKMGWDCFKEKEAQQAMNNIAKLDEDLGL